MTASDDRKVLLLVDDAPANIQVANAILKDDYRVRIATSGAKALELVKSEPVPDLILLDVEMPRMDGFEFARNVRADEATKAIPIIMITSRTADKHRNHALEIGVNEYMGKPYQEEQLLALIKRYTRETAIA